MTKNVFYTDVSERGGKIYLRYVEDGVHKKEIIDYKPELYIKTNTGNQDAVSMWDEPLERVTFADKKEMNSFIENYKDIDGFSVYGMDKLAYQFIARTYKGLLEPQVNQIKGGYIDIEVFSGSIGPNGEALTGPFPQADSADYPINLITIYTTDDNTYNVFGLEEFNGHKIGTYVHNPESRVGKLNVNYKGFRTEYELLQSFVELMRRKDINYYSGWSIEGFDNPYLVHRIQKVCGETAAKKLSPWNIIIKGSVKNAWGGEETVYDWMGCAMLDYLALFKKHGFMNPDNFKLNTVAEMVLGEGKVDYHEEGDLNTLYVRNYQKAVEYNIVDVELVKKIDDKMQLIGLTFTLTYLTKSNYQDTLGTVKPWSSLAYSMLYDRGIQPKLKGLYPGDTAFGGGFVRVIMPGRRRWVVSADLNSLN